MWSRKDLRKAFWDLFPNGGRALKGKINKLIRERGFGFINVENGNDIFFHCSALEGTDFGTLQEGDSIEFNVERGPKGARAVDIRMVEA